MLSIDDSAADFVDSTSEVDVTEDDSYRRMLYVCGWAVARQLTVGFGRFIDGFFMLNDTTLSGPFFKRDSFGG
jgi:hypothetical protein